MPIDAYQYFDNADKLQALFDKNGIPIDLHTGDGLNAMIRASGLEAEYPNTFAYNEQNQAADLIKTNLAISGVSGRAAYVFKPGESSPRCLYQKSNREYALTEPVDTIQEPKRPSFFTRLMYRIFGAYQNEMDRYMMQRREYDLVSTSRTEAFKEAVKAHTTDVKCMYSADRKMLESKFRAEKAAEEQREAEIGISERAKIERAGIHNVVNSMSKENMDFNKMEFRKQLTAIANSDPTKPDEVRSFLFRMDPEQLKSMEKGFTTFHNLRDMVEQTIATQQAMAQQQPNVQQPVAQQQVAQQQIKAPTAGN